jgi:hypothetical protein
MYTHTRLRSKILVHENRIFRWGMDMSSEGGMIKSNMDDSFDER